jgi:hypothetical protein
MNALREPVFEATQGGIAVTVFKATPAEPSQAKPLPSPLP